jgi:signal peptidase I
VPSYPKIYMQVQPDLQTNLTVPDGCYFLVGDRATNSFDSRSFGCVPRKNINGRICFCYWPPQRIGLVK